MSRKTFCIAFSGILASISVVLLLLGSVLPTGQLTVAAAASLPVIAALMEMGVWNAAGVWGIASLIALLFLPDKTVPFFFAVFLGHYPIVKYFCEKLPSRVLEWVCKFLCLNTAAILCFVVLEGTLVNLEMVGGKRWLAVLAVNAVFIVYDPAVTWAARFYSARISPKIRKG